MAVVAVAERPALLDEIGRVSAHRPFVAIGADFALDVEVVEQHKFARQLVMIRRDALRENAERRIAIAFRHVTQHLIVSAVLLDNVENVFNGRLLAHLPRNGVARELFQQRVRSRHDGHARVGALRPVLELIVQLVAPGQVDDLQRALHEPGDVFLHAAGRLASGSRPVAVAFGNDPLAIGHEKFFSVGRHAHARRIPAHGNETEGRAAAGIAHVEDRHGVDVGVCDKQQFLIRRQRQ